MGKSSGINLMHGRGKSFVDNFIDWALSVGRVVIIITELIAMGVFLSRFYYDSQLTDKHTAIKQKQQIVTFLASDEKEDRNIQDRLQVATRLSGESTKQTTAATTLFSQVPPGIIINSVTLSGDHAQIDAIAMSIDALSTFTTTLKSSPLISSISVDKIENRIAEGTIALSINTTLKKASKAL